MFDIRIKTSGILWSTKLHSFFFQFSILKKLRRLEFHFLGKNAFFLDITLKLK